MPEPQEVPGGGPSLTSAVRVRCYSGSKFAEEPREVLWQGSWRKVLRVRRRWLSPGLAGFQVVLEGGDLLELDYDERRDSWSGRRIPGPPTEPAPGRR